MIQVAIEAIHPHQGLMMEPEGEHRNSIIKQRILAVFGLVEIVLRCTLTMNDFQGLMMHYEVLSVYLPVPSSDPGNQSQLKCIPRQFQQPQTLLGYVVLLWSASACLPAPSSDPENHSWWRVHLERTLTSSNTTGDRSTRASTIFDQPIEELSIPGNKYIHL
ncbi:hypothetical protein EVAR_75100_1 [Eumeta japonica]|uniref:Uncharacterized protein n=1 Tax=Eumeta variegata TaxID=151549 RepID=A0A4C1U0R9_EUMVA|nr:hypothetical protein EVAR_75100_1 [Eumeta japonica]